VPVEGAGCAADAVFVGSTTGFAALGADETTEVVRTTAGNPCGFACSAGLLERFGANATPYKERRTETAAVAAFSGFWAGFAVSATCLGSSGLEAITVVGCFACRAAILFTLSATLATFARATCTRTGSGEGFDDVRRTLFADWAICAG
jgi:hypothetical protein